MEQGRFFYDEQDMKKNGRTCGYIGFAFGLLCGAIIMFVGLWTAAEILLIN